MISIFLIMVDAIIALSNRGAEKSGATGSIGLGFWSSASYFVVKQFRFFFHPREKQPKQNETFNRDIPETISRRLRDAAFISTL